MNFHFDFTFTYGFYEAVAPAPSTLIIRARRRAAWPRTVSPVFCRSPPSNLFNTTRSPPHVFLVRVGRLGRMQRPCALDLPFVHRSREKEHQYSKSIPGTSSAHPRSEVLLTLATQSCLHHHFSEDEHSDWSQAPEGKPTKPP